MVLSNLLEPGDWDGLPHDTQRARWMWTKIGQKCGEQFYLH